MAETTPWWKANNLIPLAGVLLTIVVYTVLLAIQIGAMQTQIAINTTRLSKIEDNGSSVAQNAKENMATMQRRIETDERDIHSEESEIKHLEALFTGITAHDEAITNILNEMRVQLQRHMEKDSGH